MRMAMCVDEVSLLSWDADEISTQPDMTALVDVRVVCAGRDGWMYFVCGGAVRSCLAGWRAGGVLGDERSPGGNWTRQC